MAKLIGKTNVAVFISGRGSNLKYLISYSKKNKSFIKIKIVVSNSKNAKGNLIAKRNKIPIYINNFKNRKEEKKILKKIKNLNIKLICLAGFMKILSKRIIKKFKNKILNIHPSLLPKYKGLNTHKKVIVNKESFTGCTVHLVNSKLDSGRIILQKKIKVMKKDNEKSLAKRLLKVENQLYPSALKKFISTSL